MVIIIMMKASMKAEFFVHASLLLIIYSNFHILVYYEGVRLRFTFIPHSDVQFRGKTEVLTAESWPAIRSDKNSRVDCGECA